MAGRKRKYKYEMDNMNDPTVRLAKYAKQRREEEKMRAAALEEEVVRLQMENQQLRRDLVRFVTFRQELVQQFEQINPGAHGVVPEQPIWINPEMLKDIQTHQLMCNIVRIIRASLGYPTASSFPMQPIHFRDESFAVPNQNPFNVWNYGNRASTMPMQTGAGVDGPNYHSNQPQINMNPGPGPSRFSY